MIKHGKLEGSDCGSVSGAVAIATEVRGSNPTIFVYCQLCWKDKNEKDDVNGPLFFYKTYEFIDIVDSKEKCFLSWNTTC